MPQITKDPLGNDVEVLSLTEWSDKNQKELSEDTLNQYAGYATGQLLRSGQKPDEFQNSLYSGLFNKGVQAGVFQPQDEQQKTQLFESFANKSFVDDASDLDLVSKSLLNTDPEQAARVADVYQRVKSGQPDPNLELDLEDVRKNIATPDVIQQARIGYAKERGLGFIDYPTGEPSKRDVWINTQAIPDRKAVYDTLDLAQGIVDPRSAALAEEWIKTDEGRTTNRWGQRTNSEIQSLLQERLTQADPESGFQQNMASAVEYASESAKEYGIGADVTAKAPTDEVAGTKQVIATPAGAVYAEGTAQRVASNRVADTAIRSAYRNLKETDPNNALVSEYSEDQFLNAARDFVRQRITTPTNQDDPTKNFVTLTDGTRAPLASAALLPKEKFAQAMDTLGLDEKEKAAAASLRTSWISANLTPIRDALFDFEGDKFLEFTQKNVDKYSGTVELTEAYLDQMEPSARKTFGAKTQGVLRSIPNSLSAIVQAVGGGASNAINWEGGQKAFADWAEADAMQEQRRGTYVNLYGGELGLGYTIASQAAPLLADIAISKGAGTLAKSVAKPVVGTAIRTTEGLMGQTAKTFIGNALKPETKSVVGNYLKKFTVAGAEKSPAQVLRAVRRDLEEKFVVGTATATQIGTSFTRSAQQSWTNTTMEMRQAKNPDGTPKYTEEEINDAATTNALYSGAITALVERGFGKVFGEGADVTAIGTANLRQIKSYSNRLTNALERGGFGGPELFDTLKQVSREVVNEGWGDAVKQIPAEALEEFTDEFTQNVVQNLLNDEQINFKQAFTQGLQAAVVGGVYGGALGTTNKIGLRQADIARDTFAGTAQSIERDLMDRTVAKLQESGGNPQTIAALQDRMRVAQRRGQAISQNIPVRAAKQEIIDRLDATSEEPFEIPTAPAEPLATKAPASVTSLAKQLAKELAVNEEELSSVQPSGTDKQGAPQITPNDVRAFVNRRTEQMGLDLNSFLPGPDITAPEGGFQLVGDEQADNPENRTFNDLSNRVVVIDGLRGRLRIEDEGVILDPEDGSTPFEVTPNKDLPVKDFEGFNTLLQEGAAVSPRRQAREVSEVTDGGQIVYGDTTYDLPEQPLIANVKKDDTGAVESMHMRVFNSKGLATWVYVAGDNVPKVETAYRTRGPEAVTNLASAVETAGRENTRRNIAAQTFKAKQSKQRRQDKRAKNNAPLVTDRGQRAAEAAPDYRATRINQPGAPQQLVEEIRAVATQLGIDPEVYTDDAELFALVAPELAAGLDLQAFTPQQKSQAVQNLARNGNNPETLLEYLISDELLPPQERVKRDSNIAALRARNSNQLKKHGIKSGASVKTILENVARTASNKAHRESAKELLRLGADSVPTSFAYLQNNIGVAGAYLPASNAVVVNLASDNGGGALDALLHELGHAVTDRVVTAPRNDFERQIRDRLMSLRAQYAERANAKYGNNMPPDLRYALEGRASLSEPFSDVDGARELVAHFYGSSKFRKQLVELSPKGERNFVQKFIDLIASLFSGQPVASKQYKELAEVITDLSNANQTLGQNPYGRTVGRVAASRAGVNHENRVGPLFGVPNPHSRDDLEWILHQVQTLRYSDLSNEEINDIILTQRFGMFTGENPNDTQFSERENKEFNKKAVQWLKDRGYQVIPIVGKYNRGENSFLVPGLTDQDAVDAANELVQDSVVTNTGMYFKGGMYHPRVGESINQPIGANDNFFSTLLDTNGDVTTIRVEYDFDTSLDSGIKYSKGDQQAAPVTKIARSLAAQGEFQVVEDREINKPMQFVDGRLAVNPALADARYEAYDAEDAGDLQELDTRLAVAIGLANESNGPDIQLSFEEVGLSPDSVIEQAAYNTLTNSDLQDLLKVKEQAKQFVASAYYHIALRNNGDNERLATAQNRVADLYRYLLRDGAGLPDAPEKFNALDISPVTMQLASRAASPAPIVRYSRAAVNIDPVQVRAQTKAGKAVGTRNPTSAKATEDGADPSNLVDLASLKRNTQAYRKNALLLLEYPIVAREFPKLAKEYAKIRGAVLKEQDKAKANGIKIKGAKDAAKKTLANYLDVPKNNVSGKMLEDAIENPESAFVTKEQPGTIAGNKEARARNKALAEFNKNLDQIKKYEAEGAVLGTNSSKALKTYTNTLDKIAKDPKHPIAKQADEIYDTLIEVTKSNLRMLMDVFPSDIRDIANLWYDGANIIAQQFAGDNYSLEQSAGVLAVFSPQKDWFMNVELAKRTMEIWTADQEYEWDDAMSARWLMRGGEPELKENKDGTVGYAKGIKPDLDENGEHRTDEKGMLLFHGWGSEKVKAKRQQAFERLQSLKGKKLKDLSPEQQAWFVRMRAETKYATSFPIVSPDGRFGTPSSSTNNKGVTKEIKLAWGTYGSIGKAISILTAPPETQMKVISDELGDQHKVRSFYNNIVDPQNADGHVTMDTHAIAALFWQAFSGNSREVGQNFGTANTATDSLTGVGGLYPAFAEAYRAVAADYGMLPRQVQSITWEAVRMLFTARWKSKPENVNGVRAVWARYQNNEITLEQAQTAVFAMATNGKDLATAVANSNDEELGLGFPSYADITEGPAPAGVGIARSRAITQEDEAVFANSERRNTWSKAAKEFLGARVHPSEIPVIQGRYMRISDMPKALQDLATVAEVSKKLQRETDMAGNDILDIVTSPVETDAAWYDLDAAFRNKLRTEFDLRTQALDRIKKQTKGLYTDSEIITYAMNLPTVTDIEIEDTWIATRLGVNPSIARSRALPTQLSNIDKNFVAEFGEDYKYEIRNRLSANRAELNGGVDVAIDRLFGAAATGIEGEVRTDKLFAEATAGAQKAWRKTVDKIMLAAGYDAKAWRENYNGSPKGSKARDEIKSLQSANIKFLMGDEPTVSMDGPDFNRAYADLENSLSAALGSENNTIRTAAENLLGAYSLAFGPEVSEGPSIALSKAPVATGQPYSTTAFHGGTYKQGVGALRPSKEGALGSGYYVTPSVDSAKKYAREGSLGEGITGGSVSVFDVSLQNPLVFEYSQAYPANIFQALGVDPDKAEAKTEKILEEKGYIGKQFQTMGQKLGYDGIIIVDNNGDVLELVAWSPTSLKDGFTNADIALSRAAQLDADYLAAVEKGDTEAAQRMVNEAAKKVGADKLAKQFDAASETVNEMYADLQVLLGQLLEYGGMEKVGKEYIEKLPQALHSYYLEMPNNTSNAFAKGVLTKLYEAGELIHNALIGQGESVRDGDYAALLKGQSIKDYLGSVRKVALQSEAIRQKVDPYKLYLPVDYDNSGNIIPLSKRFDITKQDIPLSRAAQLDADYSKAGLDTAPKAFRGRMVQLTHWSKATELKETDPSEHGNGGAGKELERRREYKDIYMPRTYFGYGKYRRETQVGVNRYSMLVNGDALYDLDRDPLDLYPDADALQKAGYARFDNRAALTLLEKAVKDAGFKGYVSTSYQAGVLFNKQKVTKVKDGDTSLPLAAPASIAKSLANLTPVTPAEEKAAGKATARRNAPELAVAAVRMIEGKITVDEYADLVGFFDPWEVKGAADAPAIDKIKQYIDASKVDKVGVAVADRTVVEARIDIPTYNRSTAAGESVYAITLHQPAAETATRVAAPLSYTSVARITNPTMVVRAISGKGEARDIAAGTGKFPLATVKGNISTITEMPADINDPEVWTEVGFNPVRSSDFVDVRSKLAVVGGSEAIMVGPRVFVRNAEFAERATGYMTDKSPRYSRALYGIVSPDVESAYAVSLDDLYINKATGEWDAGGPITNLFRAAGDLDPRLFEAAKYQERGLRLVKGRLKDLMQGFKAALKAEPNADLDDVNVALGSTEPTVSAAQRDAAESARRARVDKANEQFDRDPANQAYAAAVQAARVAYATHRNKQKYTAEIQQARDARKNSPEMQQRDAAIAAADAQYNKDIQDARAKNLVPVRRAQQQAQLRLEANSPETAKVIADFRVAIDSLSAQLSAELGQANPLSAIVDQNLGVYLTRSYKIHQDEGYAQRVLEDSEFAHQREQARQFFEREWIATTYEKWRADVAYEPYSDAEVMSLVRAEATSKNVGTRDLYKFIDKHGSTPKTIGRTTSRTDLTRFMQKGEVPAELRPLLGEIQNPIENAMRTYANLAQFLGTQRLLSQYTQLGLDNGWLVPAADVDNDPVKYRGYAPLVNTTDTRGGEPLSEYYAEPDVVEAFQTMFNPAAEATRSSAKKIIDGLGMVSARAVGTSMGALTLGSAGFFMRNLTGILTFIGANGFVPTPSNIVTALKGLYQVYYTNMEGLGADLTMLGLTEDSLISTTMRDFMRNAIEDPETVTNQIESMLGELSTPGNWLAKSWKTAKVGVDALVKLNDQIDSFYKIAYWAHEIDVQTKANKHRATPLTPQQIKQEAARVVRLTTQGRERVVPIAKEFGRSGFGLLLNSFFRFTAEMYRLPLATTQLAMQEMKSGNPVLKNRGIRRLTGLGATLALTGYGAQAWLKELLGFGDDEEEAIRKGQPIYNRDANLFFSHNPEEGTVSVFDITYVNGFSPVVDMFGRAIHHAINGRWEKVPGTIFAGMVKNFVSPQIAVEALAQASSNRNDYGAALWLEDDSFTTKGGKFLKHVISNAYKLKTPTNFYKAFAAYANNGVYDKEAALELAGKLANEFKPLRVKTDPVEEHAARSFKVLKKEMDAARKSLGDFNTFEPLSQDGVDEIYDRYEDSSIAINERLNKFARGFQKLGLSYKQLQKIAYEEADISKNRFEQAVKFNRVERFVPSDDALEMYEKRGKENGPARVQYIKQAYKKRPRYTYLKKR
jgi:hypothetical protein